MAKTREARYASAAELAADLDRHLFGGRHRDAHPGHMGLGNLSGAVVGAHVPVHDVAVDPVGGKIYWTEGTTGGIGMTASIRRSDLDGNNVEDVLTGLSVRIRDLVFVRHRVLPIFEDGFELGTASLWSSSTCAPDC